MPDAFSPARLSDPAARRSARLTAVALLQPVAPMVGGLSPLLERLDSDAAALEGDAIALGALLGEVAAALAVGADTPTEVERKYLLRSLPAAAEGADWSDIVQGYLPGELLVERLRRVITPDGAVSHFRTVKLGTGIVRAELEERTTANLFDAMWPFTVGRRVSKRRYVVADGGHRWELDRFTDRELVLAEVELADARETVVLPEWLAPWVVREVTGEDAYVNLNLAR